MLSKLRISYCLYAIPWCNATISVHETTPLHMSSSLALTLSMTANPLRL